MAVDSNHSSLIWDSSSSPIQFHSSSLSTIPDHFNRTMVAPLIFSQRKRHSHAAIMQLPSLKLRSTMTWNSSGEEEEQKFHSSSFNSAEREINLFKQNYDRARASLSQSVQHNRHTCDKFVYKKSTIQQNIDERDELTNQLIMINNELMEKISKSRNELAQQRHARDNGEMRQLKLRRTLAQLNKSKDKANEILKTNNKTQLIKEYETRLSALADECKQELAERDQQIEDLKEALSEEFHYQSDEYLKFLKATEQACHFESQKRDVLQDYIDNYESHVYRARKACCISTSHRLSKLSTQLRLYLIMELTLHELCRSSCSCGPFQRSYQTFLRLHKK